MRTPKCRKCGCREIAEIDVLDGYALVLSVANDGKIDWDGHREIDWNSSRPKHDPPRFVCLSCDCDGTLEQMTEEET